MQFPKHIGIALTAVAFYGQRCWAQGPVMYTDPSTNITFPTWTDGAGYTFGLVVPDTALTTDSYEYIGYLSCTTPSGAGAAYCGLSHGQSGQMVQALLLMAWPYESQVLTSFRFATGYSEPAAYTGNATLTTLASSVNDTAFEIVYRCENCFKWSQDGADGQVSTSTGSTVLGRAASNEAPGNPGCPKDITIPYHRRLFGQYGASFANATVASYSKYAALPPKPTTTATTCAGATPTGNATTTTSLPTATPTAVCKSIPANKTWDYVVVGGGAGGIPMADKLSEAGHSVLLIEKGPASTGEWGGSLGPKWLNGTGLTRFDVPGLCNQIWVDSTGIACSDTDQMAGCVLGGGTAVNAGLWWKPNPADWNENFPAGWHASDVAEATERAFKRIPGTWQPSMDGQLYLHQGYDVLTSGLKSSGWEYVVGNDAPDKKNRTYGHGQFMFSHGERSGPLATYLATAAARKDVFSLWTDTAVNRIVRTGAHATSVEVSCSAGSGYSGTVNLTPGTGRVIVSAGAFGTPKLLFRSGIGPADQLAIVQASGDGAKMISNDSWIELPVGSNLVEQMNTDVIVTHPDVVFYDFYAAWNEPIPSDKQAYLSNRTGILAQAAPNIGPMLWEEIKGSDGITRQLQWTSRVEGDSAATNSTHAMTISQYLGRGQQSRGRATITSSLSMTVSTQPFLHNDGDRQAVVAGVRSLQESLRGIKGLEWVRPRANQTAEDYVDSLLVTANGRRANHWMGTAKMGLDDGRVGSGNGTAVVDTNAKVYGTDNVFVLDASIFPGQLTGNPSATIVIAAEHAAAKILALAS
ncbi:cellobiose dehydrogenase [Diaporthe amygdali]|uniref:cellobiose dehydrogenase n=1 Tax=Phomopsis amygdali TaxID=1214568 RepID=UPI0022FDF1CF|nr:cellobiose dehydrogenase [Diaporthe amygdali]KAJ0120126.1 cellobiose dehydrogenase [Diaporthe amygdali]